MTLPERVLIGLLTPCGWTCSAVGVMSGTSVCVDCAGSGKVIKLSLEVFSFVGRRCWRFLRNSLPASIFNMQDLEDWVLPFYHCFGSPLSITSDAYSVTRKEWASSFVPTLQYLACFSEAWEVSFSDGSRSFESGSLVRSRLFRSSSAGE